MSVSEDMKRLEKLQIELDAMSKDDPRREAYNEEAAELTARIWEER